MRALVIRYLRTEWSYEGTGNALFKNSVAMRELVMRYLRTEWSYQGMANALCKITVEP